MYVYMEYICSHRLIADMIIIPLIVQSPINNMSAYELMV